MAQNPAFPGMQSGMYSQAYPGGVHPAMGGTTIGGAPSPWLGNQAQQQKPQLQPGWNSNPYGGDFVGNVSSQNPWSWLSQDQAPTAAGQFHRLFGSAGQAGVFDPFGSTPLVNMLQGIYQSQAAGQNRGALEAARNNEVDPSSYGYASLLSQLGGQGHMADALAQARYQSAQQNQDWLRNVVGGGFMNQLGGYLTGQQNLSAQEKLNADLQNAQKHAGMGGMLGGVLGSLVGAIPGIGSLGGLSSLFGGGGQTQGYSQGAYGGASSGMPAAAPNSTFGGGVSGQVSPEQLMSLLSMLGG